MYRSVLLGIIRSVGYNEGGWHEIGIRSAIDGNIIPSVVCHCAQTHVEQHYSNALYPRHKIAQASTFF